MELGTGIFLSSLFLGTIPLFIFTKDRWNWKKIVFFPIVLVAVCLVGYFLYEKYESWPRKLDVMWGIPLGASMSDVKFMKGNPSIVEDSYWVYFLDKNDHTNAYIVDFKDNRVRAIAFWGNGLSMPSLNGVNYYKALSDVDSILGPPSHVSRSKDDLSRLYSYETLSMYLRAEKGTITEIGIYDPTNWDNGVVGYEIRQNSHQNKPESPQEWLARQNNAPSPQEWLAK